MCGRSSPVAPPVERVSYTYPKPVKRNSSRLTYDLQAFSKASPGSAKTSRSRRSKSQESASFDLLPPSLSSDTTPHHTTTDEEAQNTPLPVLELLPPPEIPPTPKIETTFYTKAWPCPRGYPSLRAGAQDTWSQRESGRKHRNGDHGLKKNWMRNVAFCRWDPALDF